MRTILQIVVALYVFIGAGLLPGAAVNWTIYLHRAGPIRIGMSLSEVRQALGDPKASVESSNCDYLDSVRTPKGLGLMFRNGRLIRIDVSERGISTASGAQVGDGEDRIKQLYGRRIKVEPHPYVAETGHYLKYIPADPADSGYGIVFETENGVVTSFRTGARTAVAWIEGCS